MEGAQGHLYPTTDLTSYLSLPENCLDPSSNTENGSPLLGGSKIIRCKTPSGLMSQPSALIEEKGWGPKHTASKQQTRPRLIQVLGAMHLSVNARELVSHSPGQAGGGAPWHNQTGVVIAQETGSRSC